MRLDIHHRRALSQKRAGVKPLAPDWCAGETKASARGAPNDHNRNLAIAAAVLTAVVLLAVARGGRLLFKSARPNEKGRRHIGAAPLFHFCR
ncbi:hypothetical protein [Sandarakinorhabdus sp.]|uniref:hypothetical protein n=1 Tax=Sandarakinorhabdus sp. TaxID=1916663 RepID=UPI003565E6E0